MELGVAGLYPFTSDFSFVRKPSLVSAKRFSRWESIVDRARAQSMNPESFKIAKVLELKSLLQQFEAQSAKALFFSIPPQPFSSAPSPQPPFPTLGEGGLKDSLKFLAPPLDKGGVGGGSTNQGLKRKNLKEALGDLNKEGAGGLKEKGLDEIWVFIGPEGGFSEKDRQLFKSQGLPPLSLGRSTLKVGTACLTALSILKYTLNQL